MIQLILNDLDKYYKKEISATKVFKDIPFLEVKPIHYDMFYKPRAKRIIIGLTRLNRPNPYLNPELTDRDYNHFLLTHEFCHIIQRENFQENFTKDNLGLRETEEGVPIEREVIGLQYALYKKMGWDSLIFQRLHFRISQYHEPTMINFLSVQTFDNFQTLLNEKISFLGSL